MANTSLQSNWPRALNLLIGAWLFLSAFIWPHAGAAFTNAWIVGGLIVLAAIAAMYVPQARFLNLLLASYLFISTWFMPHANTGTLWNNVICAVLVFILSVVPTTTRSTFGGRPAHA